MYVPPDSLDQSQVLELDAGLFLQGKLPSPVEVFELKRVPPSLYLSTDEIPSLGPGFFILFFYLSCLNGKI